MESAASSEFYQFDWWSPFGLVEQVLDRGLGEMPRSDVLGGQVLGVE
jgi:hypothetical protein